MREFAKGFYKSKQWQQVREYVLKRDAYLCRICGAPAEEVHHITHLSPENIGDPTVTSNPENLISLCRACHFEQHRGEHGTKKRDSGQRFDEDGNLLPPASN